MFDNNPADIEQLKKKFAIKAKKILSQNSTNKLRVKPWDMNKIKRARNWFGNNERVQQVIADQLHIKK